MKLYTLILTDPISLPAELNSKKRVYTVQRVELAKYRNLLLTAISEAQISGFKATEQALIELLAEVQSDLNRLQECEDRNMVFNFIPRENSTDPRE